MTKNLPLVVVLGATACGKSKLAIELARKFNGEIISADSMQVYRGLDIVTNKVTEEEQQLAKHHMINLVNPTSRYSVIDFRNRSLSIIDDMLRNNKVPVVVGGTHYYIESLIWKRFTHGIRDNLKEDPKNEANKETLFDLESQLVKEADESSLHDDDDFEDVDRFFSKPILSLAFRDTPPEKLWNILEQVDPKTAHVFHPNDKRRVIRSLQLIQQNKRPYSELMQEVNISSDDTSQASLGGPLRYDKTCVLWLNSEEQTLNKVLDERVDEMLNRGLLAELERFHEEYNKQRLDSESELSYDKGIFQTIGFKEFHDYFMLNAEERSSPKGNKLLSKSIENMKCSTRRYAKTQLRWIRRRFLRSGARDLPSIFKLDVDFNLDNWLKDVKEPAIQIVQSLIDDIKLDDTLKRFRAEPVEQTQGKMEPGKLYCDICDRIIIGKINIDDHLRSRAHEKRVRSLSQKRAKLDTATTVITQSKDEINDAQQ